MDVQLVNFFRHDGQEDELPPLIPDLKGVVDVEKDENGG
jgi:hypothetical protein